MSSMPSDAERELITALNDPSEWGDVEPPKQPKSQKRRRSVVVSIRLTPAELAAIEEQAQKRGLSIASYLRDCALAPTRGHAQGTLREYLLRNLTVGHSQPFPQVRITITTAAPLVENMNDEGYQRHLASA
jgi:predicted DNA binding CopG/RHH family protein